MSQVKQSCFFVFVFFPSPVDPVAARLFHFPVWVHMDVEIFCEGLQTKQVHSEGQWQVSPINPCSCT